MPKPIDPNSDSQLILRIVLGAGMDLTTGEIRGRALREGREILYIPSHLNRFKRLGQIEHVQGKYRRPSLVAAPTGLWLTPVPDSYLLPEHIDNEVALLQMLVG